MRRSTVRFLPAGFALLIPALLSCGDFGRLNNCVETVRYGRWFTDDEGSFAYAPSFGSTQRCPIPLFQPGERVLTSGYVSGVKTYTGDAVPVEDAKLEIRNTTGQIVARQVTGFRRQSITLIDAVLSLDYPALTGVESNFFNHTDDLDLSIFDGCCLPAVIKAEIGLSLNYYPTPYPVLKLAGNTIPLSSTTETWTATGESGGLPHAFDWYRNGTWVASGNTYTGETGTAPFDLRVDMSNVYGQSTSNSLHVDVDGLAVQISGPSTAYPSQPVDFSVSVEGGYPPYTIKWYRNTTYVGSGSSYSGTAGSNSYSMKAVVSDTHGRTYTASRYVTISSASDVCTTSAC